MRYYRKKEILSELIAIKNMHMSLCESEETSIDILCSIQEKAILIGQEIESSRHGSGTGRMWSG